LRCYYSALSIGEVTFSIYPSMTQEIFRSFKFVHNYYVRGCPKTMFAIKGGGDIQGALGYFKMTTLLALNLKIIILFFVPISNIFL